MRKQVSIATPAATPAQFSWHGVNIAWVPASQPDIANHQPDGRPSAIADAAKRGELFRTIGQVLAARQVCHPMIMETSSGFAVSGEVTGKAVRFTFSRAELVAWGEQLRRERRR